MVKEGNRKLSCKLEAKDKIITVNKHHLQYKKSMSVIDVLGQKQVHKRVWLLQDAWMLQTGSLKLKVNLSRACLLWNWKMPCNEFWKKNAMQCTQKQNYRKEIPFTRVIVIQVDRMQFCRWRYCIQLFSQTVAKDSNDRHNTRNKKCIFPAYKIK